MARPLAGLLPVGAGFRIAQDHELAELAAVHANRAQATTWAMRPGSLSSLGSDGGGGGGGDGVGDGAREDSTSGTGDGDAAREDKRPWPLERLVIRCVDSVGF